MLKSFFFAKIHINKVIMFLLMFLKLLQLVSRLKNVDPCQMFSLLCFVIFGKNS